MRSFSARALAGVTKASERSHPGSAAAAIAVYAKRGTVARRVRFLIKTRAIRLALSPFAAPVSTSGRIDFAELYEFVVFLAPHFRNERAFMADILRLRALPVAAIAHFAHESEPLRAAGKTADKRGRTLVLPASHFNSYAGSHVGGTVPHCVHDCPPPYKRGNQSGMTCSSGLLRKCLQAFGESEKRENSLFLGLPVAQDGGSLKRFFASHDEEVGTAAPFSEVELFGQRLNADILRERNVRMTELLGETYRKPLRLVADVDE